jgi:hypothetical protein
MLTAKQVAERLNCSLYFVYKNFDKLGGFKIGKLTRFNEEVFEQRLKEMGNGSVETSREMEV